MIYNPSWDNALALLVQKTIYDESLRRLTKYYIPDNVKLVEPTDFYPGEGGARLALIDRNRAICQQLNCPVLPLVTSAKDPRLTPERLVRYRAIDSLIDSLSGKTDSDVDLSDWVFGFPIGEIHEPEPGFTREVKLLSFSFSVLSIDLQELSQATNRFPGLLVLALAMPVVYGGIHLSVWNFEFPTALEKLLWKIASIGIVATLPVLFALGLGMKIFLLIAKGMVEAVFGQRQSRKKWREVGESIYPYMGYVAITFYTLARAYLVVESFVSLRRVPIGVYWTPAWLQMIPHV
jgi:hypothetical protein